MWRKSAVGFSCGCLVAACRIRSTACHTPSRPCVRGVLWSRRFPFVEALRSGGSAGACAPLFADFTGSTASSDFFIPDTIGFGILLPSAAPVRLPGRNEDLPGPNEGRTDVLGFFDTVEPCIPSPSRRCRCGLRPQEQSRRSRPPALSMLNSPARPRPCQRFTCRLTATGA